MANNEEEEEEEEKEVCVRMRGKRATMNIWYVMEEEVIMVKMNIVDVIVEYWLTKSFDFVN